MKPMISIVIANYNYGRFIESAIMSIVSQRRFAECELIVVDGGSTDNSVDVIKKYADRIAWWCSEKDRGQSDAFNKGFAHAHGEFGCWVNADDVLLPGALATILEKIESSADPLDWIGGATVWMDAEMRIRKCSMCMRIPRFLQRYLPCIIVGGPSSFFRLDLLREVGGFDTQMYYMMDHDLWLRFLKRGARIHLLRRYLWAFRLHEQSKTSANVKDSGFTAGPTVHSNDSALLEARYPLNMILWHPLCHTLSLIKLFIGVYVRSWCDTKRWRGKRIDEIDQGNGI